MTLTKMMKFHLYIDPTDIKLIAALRNTCMLARWLNSYFI